MINLTQDLFSVELEHPIRRSDLKEYGIEQDAKYLDISDHGIISYLTGQEIASISIVDTFFETEGEIKEVVGFQYACELGRTPIFYLTEDLIQYLELMLQTNRRLNMDSETLEITQDVTISGERTGLFAIVNPDFYTHFRTGAIRQNIEIYTVSTKDEFNSLVIRAEELNAKLVRVSLSMWKNLGSW